MTLPTMVVVACSIVAALIVVECFERALPFLTRSEKKQFALIVLMILTLLLALVGVSVVSDP